MLIKTKDVDAGHGTPCKVPVNMNGTEKAKDKDGYISLGLTKDGRRLRVRSHRLAYEIKHGSIENSLTIDHLCNNRACCNPDHLRQVGMTDNRRRGRLVKINEAVAKAIVSEVSGGQKQAAVAEKYGVSPSHVSRVARGLYWADSTTQCPATVLRRK